MNDEVARLREALSKVEDWASQQQLLLEEEQRRREEAERLALDEQRRREKAEQAIQPQKFMSYLKACHSLSLDIQVVTEPSLSTQGDTTNPARRVYPKRIIPWDDFPMKQEEVWNQFSESSFASEHQFPSQHQLDYVRSVLNPVSGEQGLRYFEHDTVENAVQKLVDAVNNNDLLRDRLGSRGTLMFESHTNLGKKDGKPSESLEHTSHESQSKTKGSHESQSKTTESHKSRSKTKGKGRGSRADHFCIYGIRGGAKNTTKAAIEYKPPHKLSPNEIITGLKSEIRPERDVINKHGEGFTFASKALTAAVVTQLFSYMIGKGIQYGYVSTGQALVFLHIPDDPTIVYYYVSVPKLDVLDDDENSLHRTAVAQVFAFILRSLCAEPPPQSWHDAADKLDTWPEEYDDVLSNIPETPRKELPDSPYKPRLRDGFRRSPIGTRSSCRQPDINSKPRDDDSDDEAAPPSPSPGGSTRLGMKPTTQTSASSEGQGKGGRQQSGAKQGRIQDRPYCTHQCLFGLAHGGLVDKNCPNANSHGPRHIGQAEFLRLLHSQLAEDRGSNADSMPLHLSGSVGALFKVRLSTRGYTLVAKGVQEANLARLKNEKKIYDRLRSIQGRYVPVCLGLIHPQLPYYYDGHVYWHFILLSWAGKPLSDCVSRLNEECTVDLTVRAFAKLHQLRIHHNDAEPRNILYDEGPMIVDFERAEKLRKRKRSRRVFAGELRSVKDSVSRCFTTGR
ncbi:MAG: hypothetical protein M1840_006381 [Geoglossum simile]|nr:MAG: hypothetical protein M1840_006381 [Geoglossum simile]